MTQTFAFDRATRVTGTETGVFHGAIDEGWDINGNANGGYLLALGVRVLRDASGRPDPITVTAHYLSPGLPGDVSIETEIVKSGRQLATVSGSMRSNTSGRELMRVLGTFGDVGAMSGGFSYQVGSPPDIPSYEECVQRTVDNADTGRVTTPLMNHLNVAVRPEDAGFRTEHRSGRASVEGWFSFVDGRPIDTLALMLVVDAFPPPVFNVDIPVGWVPTIELTAHVRGIPAAGPLRCRFHSEFVQNGFLQEDGEVWDADGQLVAQSRQLALVPRPE